MGNPIIFFFGIILILFGILTLIFPNVLAPVHKAQYNTTASRVLFGKKHNKYFRKKSSYIGRILILAGIVFLVVSYLF